MDDGSGICAAPSQAQGMLPAALLCPQLHPLLPTCHIAWHLVDLNIDDVLNGAQRQPVSMRSSVVLISNTKSGGFVWHI